jgi:hypothetical protein
MSTRLSLHYGMAALRERPYPASVSVAGRGFISLPVQNPSRPARQFLPEGGAFFIRQGGATVLPGHTGRG